MWPLRMVARVGSRSLECFCFSTIIVYASLGRLSQLDARDPVSLLLTGTAIALLLCGFAVFIDWLDAKPWRSADGSPRRTHTGAPREARPGRAFSSRSIPPPTVDDAAAQSLGTRLFSIYLSHCRCVSIPDDRLVVCARGWRGAWGTKNLDILEETDGEM